MKRVLKTLLIFLIIGLIGISFTYYAGITDDGVYRCLTPSKFFVLCAVVVVLLTAAFTFLDCKFDYIGKFFAFIHQKRKRLLMLACLLAISAAASAVIEILLSRFVFGPMSTGGYFNKYRYFFIVAAVFVILYVIIRVKRNDLQIENAFAVIAVAVGSVMILSAPFAHVCWDADSHMKFDVRQSNIGAYCTQAEHDVIYVTGDYLLHNENENNASYFEEIKDKYNDNDKYIAGQLKRNFMLSHLPSSVTMSVCKFLNVPFSARVNCGKFANLICYVLICFFALKKLKSGKMIMFIIALFPTSLFLAANLSYDWWVTAFIFLGMAYFLSEYQQPDKPLTVMDSIIMCGSFVLACLPKEVYFPLLLLPFLLKKNSYTEKHSHKKHILICIASVVVVLLAFAVELYKAIIAGGDMRGGADVSTMGQIKFILSNPLEYTGILLKFLEQYVSFSTAKQYVTFMAYLGQGSGWTTLLCMLIAATITDKNEYDLRSSNVLIRTTSIGLFFVGLCMVATSMYVHFTPVGLQTINGCQPRYIIPLLFPFLSVIGSAKIDIHFNKLVYNTAFISAVSLILFIDVYQKVITMML